MYMSVFGKDATDSLYLLLGRYIAYPAARSFSPVDLSNARGKELNAQIAYRLEEYEKARAAYASLSVGARLSGRTQFFSSGPI